MQQYKASISCFPQQFIHDLLSRATNPPAGAEKNIEEVILILKALGNAGNFLSLKHIMKILPTHHSLAAEALPLRVQVEALMALRNIAKKAPREVDSQNQPSQLVLHSHLAFNFL